MAALARSMARTDEAIFRLIESIADTAPAEARVLR